MAITTFVVGHWWRYRTDQFAWTSRSTQLLDIATYFLLTVLILMGCAITFGYNLAAHSPDNYRPSIGEWWRSIFPPQW